MERLMNPIDDRWVTDSGMDMTPMPCGPPPAKGQFQQYPSRFLHYLKGMYLNKDQIILEMFCGESKLRDDGFDVTTTDLRPETQANLVIEYDRIGDYFVKPIFDVVLADPPYNVGFASRWITHEKDLPKPGRIQNVASKVVKPGGLIIILHIITIPAYKVNGVKRIGLHGVPAGPNNAGRWLNVFRTNP